MLQNFRSILLQHMPRTQHVHIQGGSCLVLTRSLGMKQTTQWGYGYLNLFQEMVSGLGLTSVECDKIASTMVAKDFRSMFKRLKRNLQYAKEQGMKKEDMKTVLHKNVNFFTGRPNVFIQSWQDLAYELDADEEEMSRLLAQFPAIIDISLEKKVRPVMKVFGGWGVPFSEFRNLVLNHPKILKLPIPTWLRPLHHIFREAGFLPHEFGALVLKYPALLSTSFKDIREGVKQLEGIGLTRNDKVNVLLREPKLLKVSSDKRMEWFESFLGREGVELMRTLVVTCPEIFVGSLSLISGKVDLLEEFGINRPGREQIVRAQPDMLQETEDDLKLRLRIARDELNTGPDEIVSFPQYLVQPVEVIEGRASFLKQMGISYGGHGLDTYVGDEEIFAARIGADLHELRCFLTQGELERDKRSVRMLLEIAEQGRSDRMA